MLWRSFPTTPLLEKALVCLHQEPAFAQPSPFLDQGTSRLFYSFFYLFTQLGKKQAVKRNGLFLFEEIGNSLPVPLKSTPCVLEAVMQDATHVTPVTE
jgi:hypothetical protein